MGRSALAGDRGTDRDPGDCDGGRALGGITVGAYAGLALATTVWQVVISQIVTLDSGLSCFLAVAFAAFVIAQQDTTDESARRRWMWLAAAALAGATLSKGLIALVIPGGALVVYTALTRDFAVWKRLHLASGSCSISRSRPRGSSSSRAPMTSSSASSSFTSTFSASCKAGTSVPARGTTSFRGSWSA
jgi:hypothetical protein